MSSALDLDHRTNPSVMIVEDEPIIAFALEEEFINAMFLVSGPFGSCATALSALDSELPDVAVLELCCEGRPLSRARPRIEAARRAIPDLLRDAVGRDRAQGIGWRATPAQTFALS